MLRVWKVASAGLAILAMAWAGHALGVSRIPAYLSDRPEACLDCHAMDAYVAAWRTGPHGKVTTCADCHVPRGGRLMRNLHKAADGLRHVAVEALHATPTPIRLQIAGSQVVQENCLRCHSELAPLGSALAAREGTAAGTRTTRPRPATGYHADGERACVTCHQGTAHRQPSPSSL